MTTAGTCAVKATEGYEFDILVSDIGLPGGNGLDVLGELRNHGPIQGIALTGFGMEADVRRSQEAGFADHLTRPVNFQKLQMTIERPGSPLRPGCGSLRAGSGS